MVRVQPAVFNAGLTSNSPHFRSLPHCYVSPSPPRCVRSLVSFVRSFLLFLWVSSRSYHRYQDGFPCYHGNCAPQQKTVSLRDTRAHKHTHAQTHKHRRTHAHIQALTSTDMKTSTDTHKTHTHTQLTLVNIEPSLFSKPLIAEPSASSRRHGANTSVYM